ncbi:tail fiber domain-containing protein [Enterobacter mori]|jgi:hypothetical protein|uniref:tail fiber domain-containing protein n=1 Tax=Enterobacter TaxID=547 RepID=UPI0009B1D90D|nr:tail fiber domain-containing protein [Enterobacter ludwigii]EMD2746374.1 tail fiber domain-containing protein [Enterobacter ludwigii]MBB2844053.1 hypothetical protein [Enterobacter ludwigii]MED7683323.1 hypothetical protein [Enterobacter ludwigii]HDR2485834.1 tail fiber domain-containing protein [Enterobacter ludwigii]
MLYNTGTIAVNGNTATGTGTNWTAPASQVRAGQTIIVMSNPVQLFQISSVNSATSMTVTPAASPALSGQKYGILVSDNISVDGLAQAMSQLIKEYDENIGAWETFATTSANQSITVTINGVSVSIPGIGKLLQKGTNGALAVKDGGTGATTESDARESFGLGTADAITFGSLILSGTPPEKIRLIQSSENALNFLSSYKSDGTRMFWFGKGSSQTDDINIYSDVGNSSVTLNQNGDVTVNPAGGFALRVNGNSYFSSGGKHIFNGDAGFASGAITVPSAASATAPTGAGVRGVHAGVDSADFNNASNINLYSWYGIGFCTAYTSPTNGVQEGKPAVYINTRNGTINAKGAVQANGVTLTSDWNAKEEVNIIEPAEALEKIAALDGYTFRYKNADSKRLTAGALAQDLDLVIPDLVIHDEATDYLVADYMGLIGYLIAAVKGLKLQIDEITTGENLNNNKGTNADGELTQQSGS